MDLIAELQDQTRAAAREGKGGGPADPARGAGDDHDGVAQIFHAGPPHARASTPATRSLRPTPMNSVTEKMMDGMGMSPGACDDATLALPTMFLIHLRSSSAGYPDEIKFLL